MDNQSLAADRSESKDLVRMERDILEDEEASGTSHKRAKLCELQSVLPSKAQSGIGGLSSNLRPIGIMSGADAKEPKNRGLDLDLNAEDMSSSINNDPFYPFKKYKNLKSVDESECGSSVVGSLDSKNSMRVWKGLKQNNFMSTTYGALPKPMPIPKTRGRKKNNNNDVLKKKMELAKKEQVDRFAKVAAPIGLLNGLNPGIINHVRNSRQVHSIIEALVRSEKTENRHLESQQVTNGARELTERQMRDYALFSKSSYLNSKVMRGDVDSYMGETKILERMPSHCNIGNEGDGLALKMSSSVTVASDNASCLSNEESGNLNSVTSLSVRAANVASQWLELLNQDIRGRIAALRRSKKRVQAVITTELPLLISREFSSNLEKDSHMTKGSSTLCDQDKASADVHAVRWTNIFAQMDKSLSEEESHLENWLNQVKEMQLHCERGLYSRSFNTSQDTDPMGNDNRLGEAHYLEKGLAVKAAAASIYSTCNFLFTAENLPCR